MALPPQLQSPGPETRQWFWLALMILATILLVYSLNPAGSAKEVDYSQFKQMVRDERFAEVTLADSYVQGKTKAAKGETATTYTAVRVQDPDLVKELEAHHIPYRGEVESHWLGFALSWIIPIALFYLIWRFAAQRISGAQRSMLSIGQSKAKIYVDTGINVTFDDVAGVDEAKEELKEIIDFLREPEKYRRLGGNIPKGVLLVGPPGTGKTLLARAVAGEARVPFFSMSGSEFVEMFVGVGAARVRDLFAQAQEKAPCIIFLDEIDALGKVRSVSPVAGGHEEREHTLQQLLVEMDGFDTRKGVIIMAATNRPEILDPALLRPGRFDRHILVDRPDIRGREDILKVHCKHITLAEAVDLRVLAARTPGFVGADLANVVNEAALLAARRNKQAVEMDDFEEAINRVVAGLEKKRRVMSPHEQEVIAYHESGHALVAESLPRTDPVHRISIIPRGIAALGYTLQLPTQDRYLMTRSELLDRLAVMLAGRAAEELVFDEISTGAQDDLERATHMARSMVASYGMSEKLGPMTYGNGKRPHFMEDAAPFPGYEVSEQTVREIDEEVRTIVDTARARALDILREKRSALDTVAHALLEKETIEGDEFRALIHGEPKTSSDAAAA
jgi:cell division protease FtsH